MKKLRKTHTREEEEEEEAKKKNTNNECTQTLLNKICSYRQNM